tara:strand:+ start:1601 stop:2566 length:966 start_codon:yes stop_codon:yes gene_type:complete
MNLRVSIQDAHFFGQDDSLAGIFARYGFEIVDSIAEADLVLGQTRRRLAAYTVRYPQKKFALVAEDPRSERTHAAFFRGPLGKRVHLLNVFSGEFYWDNYSYTNMLGVGEGALEVDIPASHFKDPKREKALCAMMAYSDHLYHDPAPPTGDNLHRLRRDLVESFEQDGFADVSGRDWPKSSATEEDDFQAIGYHWADKKLEKFSRYWFGLSIENTLYPYYVTEKIWQSIVAGALPVYYGGGVSTIYDDFPADSFVDVAQFASTKSLLSYLRTITPEEAAQRLSICRKAYNEMLKRKPASNDVYWQKATENVCLRLRSLFKK